MNTVKIPGLTADACLYQVSCRYRSEAAGSFGNRTNDNQVYMQGMAGMLCGPDCKVIRRLLI
jgi:hypothetical protein